MITHTMGTGKGVLLTFWGRVGQAHKHGLREQGEGLVWVSILFRGWGLSPVMACRPRPGLVWFEPVTCTKGVTIWAFLLACPDVGQEKREK